MLGYPHENGKWYHGIMAHKGKKFPKINKIAIKRWNYE